MGADGLPLREAWRLDHQDNLGEKSTRTEGRQYWSYRNNGKDEIMEMPAEVDFSNSVPNPYIGKARRRVTMNIDG